MSERADEMNEQVSRLIQKVLREWEIDPINSASLCIDICRELNEAGYAIIKENLNS